MDKGDGSAEAWIATFTRQLRSQLPAGQFILSHAREFSGLASRDIHVRTDRIFAPQRSLHGTPGSTRPTVRPASKLIDERPVYRFSVNNLFAGGAYLKVDSTVGDDIDWVGSVSSFERPACKKLT